MEPTLRFHCRGIQHITRRIAAAVAALLLVCGLSGQEPDTAVYVNVYGDVLDTAYQVDHYADTLTGLAVILDTVVGMRLIPGFQNAYESYPKLSTRIVSAWCVRNAYGNAFYFMGTADKIKPEDLFMFKIRH